MSLDVHLDLGFSKNLEALSKAFHHLRSCFFLIPALYDVGYWGLIQGRLLSIAQNKKGVFFYLCFIMLLPFCVHENYGLLYSLFHY